MYVAIDIGGTKTLAVVYDAQGKEIRRAKHPTTQNYDEFITSLNRGVEELIKETHLLESIAIAVPGLVDYRSRKVANFGNLSWQDVDIRQSVEDYFSVPTLLDNDANYGALGEANLGAGVGYDTVLYVTISTGIGTGVTYKGKIDRAMSRSEGGQMHFRHQGALMRWEEFASGKAFFEKYHKFGKDVPKGDPIWDEWAEDISLGIGSLIAVIQPDVIVIGGSMGEWLEKYRDHLLHSLEITRAPVIRIPPIVEASDPHNAVINGCLFAMEEYAKHH